jgi:SAM-dependent methyltransferase
MAHKQQLRFIQLVNDHLLVIERQKFNPYKIVEIGSFNVNGSPREFLQTKDTEYIGVDLCEGNGVDLVSFGHELKLQSESTDFLLSCECFEHDPQWLDTFRNMYRIAKPGGIIAFTCASTGRLEHGTKRTNAENSPGTQFVGIDYYKNLTEKDFYNSLKINKLFSKHYFFYEKSSFDLYFVGQKNGGVDVFINDNTFIHEVKKIKKLSKLKLKLIELPVFISRLIMREDNYQEFSINYLKKIKPFRSYIKNLFKKRANLK